MDIQVNTSSQVPQAVIKMDTNELAQAITTNAAVATTTTITTIPTTTTSTIDAKSVVAAEMVPKPPIASSKTLKRCLSVPIIQMPMRAAQQLRPNTNNCQRQQQQQQQQQQQKEQEQRTTVAQQLNEKICQQPGAAAAAIALATAAVAATAAGEDGIGATKLTVETKCISKQLQINSNPASRDVSPTPMLNIFATRARRYSASYSPRGGAGGVHAAAPLLCLTSRVTQLRQEECLDMKTREINHEREVHSAIQISQSWEDLTLAAENWSCKAAENFSNPLQLILPTSSANANSVTKCSSPSPSAGQQRAVGNAAAAAAAAAAVAATAACLRLPHSPSPTRRIFATRRSMSPIAIRPSQLAPVKRKFELDETCANGWNSVCSPPPLKKIFTDSNSSSSVCQSPSSVCPSPDSGTFDGRITPMDDARSETSSISGWSTVSESSSCDGGGSGGGGGVGGGGGKTSAPSFINKLVADEAASYMTGSELCGTPKTQKSFYVNKQGISGTKKYVVNHAGGIDQQQQKQQKQQQQQQQPAVVKDCVIAADVRGSGIK